MLEDSSVDNGVLTNHAPDLASHLDTIMDVEVSVFQGVNGQVGVTPHPKEVSSTSQPPYLERRKGTTEDALVQDFPIDQGVRESLKKSLR